MIIWEIIIGCIIGFILGIIPNIHINTIGYFFIIIGFFALFPQKYYLFITIAISQQITSFIPVSLFGIPNDTTIMTTFPAYKYFREGKAKQAIFLCMIGSFFGSILGVILLPLLYLLYKTLFNFYIFIAGAIIFILILFIFSEKKTTDKLCVFAIIMCSGTLGILTLKYNFFVKEPIFVCIAGLFGFPTLIQSIFEKQTTKIKQQTEIEDVPKKDIVNSIYGAFASLFMILIPSFSSTQASVIVSKIKQKLKSSEYLILYASVAVCSLIFSIFLACNFGKSRIGYISILLLQKQIPQKINYIEFGAGIIFTVCIAILLVLLFLNNIITFINKTDLKKINIIIIITSTILLLIITNFHLPTIFVFLLSIGIGFLPIIFKKSRIVLTAYLMIPTLLFYI
jgi:TctA family transporter